MEGSSYHVFLPMVLHARAFGVRSSATKDVKLAAKLVEKRCCAFYIPRTTCLTKKTYVASCCSVLQKVGPLPNIAFRLVSRDKLDVFVACSCCRSFSMAAVREFASLSLLKMYAKRLRVSLFNTNREKGPGENAFRSVPF